MVSSLPNMSSPSFITATEFELRSEEVAHGRLMSTYIGALRFRSKIQGKEELLYCLEENLSPRDYVDAVLFKVSFTTDKGTSNRLEIRLSSQPKRKLMVTYLPMASASTRVSLVWDYKQGSRIPNMLGVPIPASDAQLLFSFDGSLANENCVKNDNGDCNNFGRTLACLDRLNAFIAAEVACGNTMFDCIQTSVTKAGNSVRLANPQVKDEATYRQLLVQELTRSAWPGYKKELPQFGDVDAKPSMHLYMGYPLSHMWRSAQPRGNPNPKDPGVAEFLQELKEGNVKRKSEGKRQLVHTGYPWSIMHPEGSQPPLPLLQEHLQKLSGRVQVLHMQASLCVKLSSTKFVYSIGMEVENCILLGFGDPLLQKYTQAILGKGEREPLSIQHSAMCDELGIDTEGGKLIEFAPRSPEGSRLLTHVPSPDSSPSSRKRKHDEDDCGDTIEVPNDDL